MIVGRTRWTTSGITLIWRGSAKKSPSPPESSAPSCASESPLFSLYVSLSLSLSLCISLPLSLSLSLPPSLSSISLSLSFSTAAPASDQPNTLEHPPPRGPRADHTLIEFDIYEVSEFDIYGERIRHIQDIQGERIRHIRQSRPDYGFDFLVRAF